MDVDLNENNYDYSDLLQLFGLNPNFNIHDVKKAKKKVLQLHPDKSNLPKEYFLFFRKMYYKIEEIYNYTHHSENEEDFKKNIDIETHFKDYLERKNIDPKKNYKEFSKEFNKMFEEVYVKENIKGYGDWLKSDEDIYDKNNIENSRKKLLSNQMIEISQIEEVGLQDKQSLYAYDVKESHSKPIIAMDVNEVYNNTPKYKNVHEYQQHLANEDKKNIPINSQQSEEYLKQKEALLNNQSKQLAYERLKVMEKTNNNYNTYISKYLSIE